MQECDLVGRDCLANKSSLTFDCLTSCDGIYADIVQWTDPESMGVKDIIQPLISEYETFKQNNVRHFAFDAEAEASPNIIIIRTSLNI